MSSESDLDAIQTLAEDADLSVLPRALVQVVDLEAPREKHTAPKTKLRLLAEALFTMSDCSLKELAARPEFHGVGLGKLRRWKTQDGWDLKRATVNKAAMLRIYKQMGDNLAEKRAESLQRLQNVEDLTYAMLTDQIDPLQRPSFDKAAKILIETVKAKDDIHEKVVAAVNPENQPQEAKLLEAFTDADLFEMSQLLMQRRLVGAQSAALPEPKDAEDAEEKEK